MQLRATGILVLPLFVFSIAGYGAPAASPLSEIANEAVLANPSLGDFVVSFEQLRSMPGTQAGITSGLPKSFLELLPASGNRSIRIEDRGDTRHDALLLSLLDLIIPLFGLMALPIDQTYIYRIAPNSHKTVPRSVHRKPKDCDFWVPTIDK
jgi:hypothetical protein